jgi:AraC family transcriptional regulator
MRAQRPSVAIASDDHITDLSAVAARLVEAACFARDGNGEATKTLIARAIALLRGDPSAIPSGRPLECSTDAVVGGGLPAWRKRRLTAYIDMHLAETILVEHLAELLNLSASHFSRAFRTSFGTSAHDYVTRRRIEAAQGLMLTTSEALCTIALRCGLSDQSHFTRVFRRIVGETPYAWRRTRSGEIGERHTGPSRNRTDSPQCQFSQVLLGQTTER